MDDGQLIIYILELMKHLLQAIQARSKNRKQYYHTAVLFIEQWLQTRMHHPESCRVQCRGSVCTVILGPQEDKTAWFLKRADYLEQINKKLVHDGREIQIKEMRVK